MTGAFPRVRTCAAQVTALAQRLLLAYTGLDQPHPAAAGLHAERRGFTFVYRHPGFAAHTSRCVENLDEHEAVVSEQLAETYPAGAYQGYRGYESLGTPGTPVRQARESVSEPPSEPLMSLREAIDSRLLSGTLGAVKQARKRAVHGFPRHAGQRPAPGHPVKLYRPVDLAAWETRRRGRP